MSDHQPCLHVQGLTAGYGGVPIINEVEFRARRGELTAIVGPNGAGKSTLLKCIVGLVRPLLGKVALQGKDVTAMPAHRLVREGIAYIPQVANVFPSLTVRENLEMGGYALKSGVNEKIESVCDMFPDLRLAIKRPARTLSGGQRTMLAVSRALMLDPSVLILDEPTAGLAPKFVDAVWTQIDRVQEHERRRPGGRAEHAAHPATRRLGVRARSGQESAGRHGQRASRQPRGRRPVHREGVNAHDTFVREGIPDTGDFRPWHRADRPALVWWRTEVTA